MKNCSGKKYKKCIGEKTKKRKSKSNKIKHGGATGPQNETSVEQMNKLSDLHPSVEQAKTDGLKEIKAYKRSEIKGFLVVINEKKYIIGNDDTPDVTIVNESHNKSVNLLYIREANTYYELVTNPNTNTIDINQKTYEISTISMLGQPIRTINYPNRDNQVYLLLDEKIYQINGEWYYLN